uniref:Transposon Ty3-I Gag-Pol polyprotein n=1 Tax=Vitis vinifera TaxID=29760 RepID=A5BJ24_VITVI|nr:hypothetical protein VITISV_037671 [Vitis vinifera]
MGSEDYFDWRESMERRQRESEQHVQSLLHETRRLKEENDKLCAQVSSSSPSHKRQPKSLWPKPIKTDLAKWDQNHGSTHPIDGIITFPPVNANRVLRPHKDALILTLGISVFNVNETPTIYPRKPRTVTIWIQWSHDNLSRRRCITCSSWSDHPKCAILSGKLNIQIGWKMRWSSQRKEGSDQIVDAIARHEMLFFIDAFFGYHQIPMFQPYEEKMALVTPQGLYCYRVITFRLKNVGARY